MASASENTLWARLGAAVPLLVIVGSFTWASVIITSRRAAEAPPDALVIRIGHWQLEAGVRKAFDELGEEFANHPITKARYGNRPVVVRQVAVPESTYGQWTTCQMMGGTAPDLVELGVGQLPDSLWREYETRYFERLTDMAGTPNPYNAGTPFAQMELRQTYVDGMRAGYRDELQEYTKIPLSRFTERLFYNKDLFTKLTGLPEPPVDYRGFLESCEKISRHRMPDGNYYAAIASSGYHMNMWNSGMFDPITFDNLAQADFNRDGYTGSDETYAAIKSGRLSFDAPPFRAKFLMTAQVMRHFQPGFSGQNRDEAVMKWARQNAVFITTGTWDVRSLQTIAKGDFEVGIMKFPQPAPTDPEFGRLIVGPIYDNPSTAFCFGVTRFSKHPEVARDFLLFLASVEGNRKLNDTIGWIPAIEGVPLPPELARFAPVNRGVSRAYDFLGLGGDTNTRYSQDFTRFLSNPSYTYTDLAAGFEPFYRRQGQRDWLNQQRDWRRGILNTEKLLAGLRAKAVAASGDSEALWIKYRSFTAARQVMPEVGHAVQRRIVTDKPIRPVGPYEFLEEAKANIRKRAEKQAPTDPIPAAGTDKRPPESGQQQSQPPAPPGGQP